MTFKTGFKFGLGFVCASALAKTTGAVITVAMARAVRKNKEQLVNSATNRVEKFIYGPDGPPTYRPRVNYRTPRNTPADS